jgi:D-lactate dehydrogenase
MKIAFFSSQPYDIEYFNKYNTKHEFIFHEASLQEHTVNLAEGCDAVCVFVNDKVTSSVLGQLAARKVKAVVLRCAGYNNVDLDAAKSMGIRVLRVPAYSPHAVAEHTVALILTLNRKTHKAYNRVREGNFSLDRLIGFDLYNKTTGIIGMGKIGEVFAKIMIGFGCKVKAYDINTNDEMEKIGIEYVQLEELLGSADIISLHCPLNDQTRHIINTANIARMKTGVMLINTGRGALVDTLAVVDALKSGKIGYLGIDVYEQEENLFFRDLSENIIADDTIMRLMSFPNVLITAHQAFFTDEALSKIATVTLQNLSDIEMGKASENSLA